MLTLNEIQARIHPVPQKIEISNGTSLTLTAQSKFSVTCTEPEQGPVKTAVETLCAFLENTWELCENGFCGKIRGLLS